MRREIRRIMMVKSKVNQNETMMSFYTGPLSAAVPGEVKGMMEAHERYGKLDWRDLVQPSIDLAREGFLVTYALATAIKRTINEIKDPSFRYLSYYY